MKKNGLDEIPPMSEEWNFRIRGYHKAANSMPGVSWLDYPATRRMKRDAGLIPDEL